MLCSLVCLCFSACSLLKDNTVTGTVEDAITGYPLEDVSMTFHAISPGGAWFGSVEKDKYEAVSGIGGKFFFEAEEKDLDYKFSPQLDKARSEWAYDSLNMMWNYLLTREGIYRDQMKNNVVRLGPSRITVFRHPWFNDRSYETDSIIVSAYFQTDTSPQLLKLRIFITSVDMAKLYNCLFIRRG